MKRKIVAFLAAGALLLASAGAVAVGGGNSAPAHACQDGGYQALHGLKDGTSVSFGNTGECVSFAARGGALYDTNGNAVQKVREAA